MVIIFIGIIATVSYSGYLSREILKHNNKTTENVYEKLMEGSISKTEQIFVDIIMGKYDDFLFFNENTSTGFSNIQTSEIYRNLARLEGYYPELVRSIDIYYHSRDVLISNYNGIKHGAENIRNIGWVEGLSESTENFKWDISIDQNGGIICTYARTYPNFTEFSEAYASIGISFYPAAIKKILEDNNDITEFFVLDDDNIISTNEYNAEFIRKIREKLIDTNLSDSNLFEIDDGNVKKVINVFPIGSTGWYFVRSMPADVLYKDSFAANILVILSCIFAFIVVILVGGRFSHALYKPILKLTKMLNIKNDETLISEYELIHDNIENLNSRLSQMQKAYSYSTPSIIHSFVNRIINNTINGEAGRVLKILDVNFKFSNFRAIRIFDEALYEKNCSRLFACENYTGFSMRLTNSTIVSIVNYKDESAFSDYVTLLKSEFESGKIILAGECRQYMKEFHISYKSIDTVAKYTFFDDSDLIIYDDIAIRENSPQVNMDDDIKNIAASLKDKDIEGFHNKVEEILGKVLVGNLSSENANQILLKMLQEISIFLKKEGIRTEQVSEFDVWEHFSHLNSQREFKNFIFTLIERAFLVVDTQEPHQRRSIIEDTKAFIEQNLSKDISLNIVAENVFISPRYLSRIFKEETGVNFVSYVMDRRMEKAKELLSTTDFSIEVIAGRVGFSGAAYFIKKFKDEFGMTPKSYKLEKKKLK